MEPPYMFYFNNSHFFYLSKLLNQKNKSKNKIKHGTALYEISPMQPLKITCLMSTHSLKKYAYYLVVLKARYKTAYILGMSPVICVVLYIPSINI